MKLCKKWSSCLQLWSISEFDVSFNDRKPISENKTLNDAVIIHKNTGWLHGSRTDDCENVIHASFSYIQVDDSSR